ncbi:MAG: amidohydrolase [Clostridia bacterium]|nr:amidohydrolase [Clostridia bacterium]
MNQILELVCAHKADITASWESLHGLAEGPFEEHRTSEYVARRLSAAGYHVQSGLAGTGVVASLGQLSSPVIALRADMDALSFQIDGVSAYRHTCGHDAHTAMVIAAGEILAAAFPEACGRLKLVFQPAEETGLGAAKMADAGAIDDVDAMFGIHLRPLAECPLGRATPCLWHSAGKTLRYSITGVPSHTGRPHLGVNAASAVAAAAVSVNAIRPDPLRCATVNVVSISAGLDTAGVIPASGQITINIRADSDEHAEELRGSVDRAVKGAVGSIGAEVERAGEKTMPAPMYDAGLIRTAREAIAAVLGDGAVIEKIITPGSEDFHVYPRRKPGLRTAYIGLGANLVPGLHHPDAAFHKDALLYGTAILIEAFRRAIAQEGLE